ncbi:MAG: TrkA family potassium uptake protein [Halobacteriales archaeon]
MSSDTPETGTDSALEELFYSTDRVQFVYWQRFSGGRPTVALTAAVTLLAFITGLSNLSQTQAALVLDGPLAGVLPPGYARFGGVLFAFILGVVTVGLQRRKRIALYTALVVLSLVGLVPLVTLQTTDIPLLVLVLVTVPLLVWNRDRFDQSLDLSSLQIASLSSIVGVGVYGVVGSYGLRESFGGLETWPDAVYYVIVTFSTVGYGDITPTTPTAKWFSLSIIVLGSAAFTVAIGSLIVPAIENRMAAAFGNMTASELKLLEDHVLVLGYGDITESLLEELDGEVDVVVVTPDSDVASELSDEGFNVLTDDPTDEAALRDARIDAARGVVVATRDDAEDMLAIVAAKRVNPDIRIVAAANHGKNVDKLEEVGADEVISPMTIGGRLIGRSILEKSRPESLFGPGADGAESSDTE